MGATSTNMDSRYLLSRFLPTITVEDADLENQNPQIEIFASTMVKSANSLNVHRYYRLTRERVPVIARRIYGNTSCWWMIMLASGQNHPLLIDSGTLIALPDISYIEDSAIKVSTNNSLRTPTFHLI